MLLFGFLLKPKETEEVTMYSYPPGLSVTQKAVSVGQGLTEHLASRNINSVLTLVPGSLNYFFHIQGRSFQDSQGKDEPASIRAMTLFKNESKFTLY